MEKKKIMKGLFITFEGLDGSGKTTQIKLLHDFLRGEGLDVIVTREPGGTEIGDRIRDILLSKKHAGMNYRTEALLFLASRAELVSKTITPALEKGRVVICDRFFDSTVVYQGIARGLGEEQILNMSLWAAEGLIPDITFLLSVKVSMGDERIKIINRKRDRIEVEKDLFKEKIYQGYLKIAQKNRDRFVILNGGDDIQMVFDKIKNKVLEVLKGKKLL